MADVIRKNEWSEEELQQAGFERYDRRRQLVMARPLPESESPKTIHTANGETLVATTGYMICYIPGDSVRAELDGYDHWPVEPNIFIETYAAWDEPDWTPNLVERHLISMGCSPYYKRAGVWAKQLDEDVLIQSLEHEKPVRVESGRMLAIGSQGEPYSMGEKTFHDRYELPDEKPEPAEEKLPVASPIRSAVQKLLKFFRG
jgi:hypothetical protein